MLMLGWCYELEIQIFEKNKSVVLLYTQLLRSANISSGQIVDV